MANEETPPESSSEPGGATEPATPAPVKKSTKKKTARKKNQKKEDPADVARSLAVFFLTFITGSFVTFANTFPYEPVLREAFESARDMVPYVYSAFPGLLDNSELNFWGVPRTSEVGVTIHQKDKAFQGYTLYGSGHHRGAYLLDMEGKVAHEWGLDFKDVWPDPKHVKNYEEERFVYWRRVHMFPNGDLLAQYYGAQDTPYGYGLVKVDKDSKLIWKSDLNVHHDFDVAPDGSIWSLDQAFRDQSTNPVEGVTHLSVPVFIEDFIVKLSPDGKLLKRINVYDALVNSPFRHVATLSKPDYPEDTDWDPLHTNGIAVITSDFASHHDFAEPGMVMFSMRRNDTLAILDPETEKVVWANRGFHSHQHDPDPLPNGNVMIYDNRGHGGVEGISRIIEFDPVTNAIVWMYTGSAEVPFQSKIRGNQQVLPNDNVLTHEHSHGRILEVTRAGEIVWEYHNPVREDGAIAGVGSVMRYAPEYVQFDLGGPRK